MSDNSRLDDYECVEEIGAGQFGKVVKVRRKSDNRILVWKQLEYGAMDEKEKAQLVTEVNILREVKHPNVVRYYERIIDKQNQHIYIVMEYCERGDLAVFLKNLKADHETIPEKAIWEIFQQIVLALHEIHHRKIMHRDLKPANIFLDGNNNVKLGDFGLSKKLSDNTNYAYTNVGTPYYMSPEQIEESKYSEKSDIWACGCLLYELGALVPPFPASNYLSLAMKIKNGKFERLGKQYSDELMRVISWCLQKNPENRPSVDDLLSLPSISIQLREKRLSKNKSALKAREEEVAKREEQLQAAEMHLQQRNQMLDQKQQDLVNKIQELQERKAQLIKQANINNSGNTGNNNNNNELEQQQQYTSNQNQQQYQRTAPSSNQAPQQQLTVQTSLQYLPQAGCGQLSSPLDIQQGSNTTSNLNQVNSNSNLANNLNSNRNNSQIMFNYGSTGVGSTMPMFSSNSNNNNSGINNQNNNGYGAGNNSNGSMKESNNYDSNSILKSNNNNNIPLTSARPQSRNSSSRQSNHNNGQ